MKSNERFASNWFKFFAHSLVRFRSVAFILLILFTALAVIMAGKIRIDNSLEVWFLEDDPSLVAYNEFKDRYGSDFEVVLVLVDCGENGVFRPEALNQIWEKSKKLEKNDKVFTKSYQRFPCAIYRT